MSEPAIPDQILQLILKGEETTFSQWQTTYADIYKVANSSPEHMPIIYAYWVGKISPELESSELILRKLNNIFAYPSVRGIIKRKDIGVLRMPRAHLMLTGIEYLPSDIIRIIIQLMLQS